MQCADLEARLTEFLEGELDAATEAAALEHLATCSRCDTVLAQTRTVIDLAGRHGRTELDPVDQDRLLDRIVGAARATTR
jgi:anti-sigma factor RsiW